MKGDDYLWDASGTPDPEVERLERLLRIYRAEVTTSGGSEFPEDVRRFPGIVDGEKRLYSGWPTSHAPVGEPVPAATVVVRAESALSRVMLAHWAFRWAAAASVAFALGFGAFALGRQQIRPWSVSVLGGSAQIGRSSAHSVRQLAPGEWLETGVGATARLNVGTIGKAFIGPQSRVKLVRAAGTEHRLAIARGTIHARIWAPPRFFLVETPGAIAIDLGCEYTLTVDSLGAGWLRVQSGEVELVKVGQAVLVPAGNRAPLLSGGTPGLPVSDAAGAAYSALSGSADSAKYDDLSVKALLRASDVRHTITLWHLMRRVGEERRVAVIDRLLAFAPLPSGVTRAAVIAQEPDALDAWRSQIASSWSTESVPAWKRVWRKLWRSAMAS
ncbi:MAG: hypothetical protein H0U13_11300 [Gemmatimonadaceae bacterium]|nr:hypothetical protein [Gemmatimonadaceae bacterium]